MGSGYGITKDSKAPEDAWLYLSEYVGKDLDRSIMGQFLKTGYGIPVRYSLMAKWEPSKEFAPPSAKLVQPAMKTYAVMGRPISPAKTDFDKLINDSFNAVWAGTTTMGDAVKEIKRLSGPILDQNKQTLGVTPARRPGNQSDRATPAVTDQKRRMKGLNTEPGTFQIGETSRSRTPTRS
jgi:multiple sugar transport system substrate-binding protein